MPQYLSPLQLCEQKFRLKYNVTDAAYSIAQ
jgi:hypothetical protein